MPRLLTPERHWRTPSQAQEKDQFGNENQTRFRLTGRLSDGHVAWRGWFDDRDDADAFLWAIANGSLGYERALWDLPSPAWHPDFGDLFYDLATVTFLTASAGSTQTWTSPSDWNNSDNTVECVGPGGTGAVRRGNSNEVSTGGGGGQYAKIVNFSVATPGTTTATYQIGAAAASITLTGNGTTQGSAGGSATWFNSATDPGAGANDTKCSARPGQGGAAGAQPKSGGAGGTGGWGTTLNAGGRGGDIAHTSVASGGGAAASSGAVGGNGTDSSGTNSATKGGDSATATGSAGLSGTNQTTSNGGAGTDWDGTHGSGAASGGARESSSGTGTSGTGGAYGAGSGGAITTASGTCTAGASSQGIIVITYTVAGGVVSPRGRLIGGILTRSKLTSGRLH